MHHFTLLLQKELAGLEPAPLGIPSALPLSYSPIAPGGQTAFREGTDPVSRGP